MNLLFLIGCLVNTVAAGGKARDFFGYAVNFKKNYNASDLSNRFQNFETSKRIIERHNSKNLSYTMGLNEFSDLSPEEFKRLYLGYRRPVQNQSFSGSPPELYVAPPNQVLAASLDWRNSGAVTPVKNQGGCGSCWSYATTGAIEGATKLRTGRLVSLSQQQLLDCSGSAYGNGGCNGGFMDGAYKYVIANRGIGSEAGYPYRGVVGRCNSQTPAAATVSRYVNVAQNNEADLISALNIGPVAVAVDASNFQNYRSGIFNGFCGRNINHAVLIVGYTPDSYIVKNSWGVGWGENGYFRIVRGQNKCAIASYPSYPVV
jgi:C1A family cysteine protease